MSNDSINKQNNFDFSNYNPLDDKPEDYMNEKQLAFFENKLNNMLIKLKEEESSYLYQEINKDVKDEIDASFEEYERSFKLRLHDKILKLITSVENAIRLIQNGKYGYCSVSGEPIGLKRLLSKPTATLCIEQQKKIDNQNYNVESSERNRKISSAEDDTNNE